MKAARIKITKELLEEVLGLKWQDVTIVHAQIDHSYFQQECLELVVSGDGLYSPFEVQKGQKIKRGHITVHHKEIETEILPASSESKGCGA